MAQKRSMKILWWLVIIFCLAIPVLLVTGQEQETYTSPYETFTFTVPPEVELLGDFDISNETHQMLVASYQFDIGVDTSLIDDTKTALLSNHTGDDLIDEQIIVSVVMNENWQPFDTTDDMLAHWFTPESAEMFDAITYDEREGVEQDVSSDDGTGLYSIVMLDDGLYVITVAISPDPAVEVDALRPIVEAIQSDIRYEPADIIALDELETLEADASLLASPIPSPTSYFTFRAPVDWGVRINRNNTITLASQASATNDLPEYALEFEVQPLSGYARQPEIFILERVGLLSARFAEDDEQVIDEWNLNGRRMATFDDYADFTGITLVIILDDGTVLVMNGISSIDDAKGLRNFAIAVADSIDVLG